MSNAENTMHFIKPADRFLEAIPIGNGRLGAIIYGQPMKDRIYLNEASMWSGSRQDSDREDAHEYLPEIRKLLLSGKNYEAQRLFAEHFTCKGEGTAYANGAVVPFGCYQSLGNINIDHFQRISCSGFSCDQVNDYSRDLYLDKAVTEVSFCLGEVGFKREYLASGPDQVIAIRYSCTQKKGISFSLTIDRPEHSSVSVTDNNVLQMEGYLDDGKGGKGIHYSCHIKISNAGGRQYSDGTHLQIREADEAVIYISARTNMKGFLSQNTENDDLRSLEELDRAYGKGWESIYSDHIADYSKLYVGNSICFGGKANHSQEDISERIFNYSPERRDYGLLELYYGFARYLLISSSRKGGFPSNLQGIWAEEIQTPWNGDWHLNAQQELYWLAEMSDLSECHLPYLELTEQMVEPGKHTAMAYYGSEGWITHICVNPWDFTSPCESADWGSNAGSAAWLCHHLWEHYEYSGNVEYLAHVYPIMEGAAIFYMNNLVEDPQSHMLVTCPSSSPENLYYDENGNELSLCAGPSYDQELVGSLLSYCIEALNVLEHDSGYMKQNPACADEKAPMHHKLTETLERLAPVNIGKDGRIMEWHEEYREALVHHRHIAHLWGLYPGDIISRDMTPDMAAAAGKTLERRGITTAGWANAYRMCCYCRLGMGDKALKCMETGLRAATMGNMMNLAYHCDERKDEPEMPDLINNDYPFQMDGNEAHATGLALMLVDSRMVINDDGDSITQVVLLPALPAELKSGYVRGMRTKGGFEISFKWEDGLVTKGRIVNKQGKTADVNYNNAVLHIDGSMAEISI